MGVQPDESQKERQDAACASLPEVAGPIGVEVVQSVKTRSGIKTQCGGMLTWMLAKKMTPALLGAF
jgi:hypothetical protein